MKKNAWKKKIKQACEEAGTYEDFFDLAIEQLSLIMETRDEALKQYKASGGNPVVAHTNKGGATNIVKNPALQVINECNQQALAYWRDLGLTPKGFRMIQGEAGGKKKGGGDAFAELLSGMEI